MNTEHEEASVLVMLAVCIAVALVMGVIIGYTLAGG